MRALVAIGVGMLMAGGAGGQDLATAKAEFAKWDRELNAVYGELKRVLGAERFATVREEQRAWVQHRDYIAKWEPEAQGNEPAGDPDYWKMAAGLTKDRVGYLRAWKGIGEAVDWSGVYRDSYGGELKVVERGGKLYFTLNVVRGPTHHVGVIGGAARRNGGTAWFSITAEGGEKETWLTFLKNREGDGRVEVVGENTQFFHGARAYFDGNYLRTSLLAGKAAEEVVKESETAAER